MQSANIHQQEIVTHINHTWAISDKIKPAISWFVLVAIISGVFSYLFTLIVDNDVQPVYRYCFALFFLLSGIPHILIFPKWMPLVRGSKGFFYSLLLSVVIVITVFTVFRISLLPALTIAATAGFAFLLPMMIQLCWHYFSGIEQERTAWYMPEDMQPEIRMSLLLLNSIPFTIEISTGAKENKPMQYPIAFNAKLSFSVIFCRFLYDRMDVLKSTNSKGEAAGWYFFVKRWYGLKNIDANKSLEKNDVKENDIIIIERIEK